MELVSSLTVGRRRVSPSYCDTGSVQQIGFADTWSEIGSTRSQDRFQCMQSMPGYRRPSSRRHAYCCQLAKRILYERHGMLRMLVL